MTIDWDSTAQHLVRLHDATHEGYAAKQEHPTFETEQAWKMAARAFREELHQVRAPMEQLIDDVRAGDTHAQGPVLDFLAADPWFFGSGYLMSKAMRALANCGQLDERNRRRAQQVVLHRLANPRARLRHPTRRLAVAVWNPGLRAEILELINQLPEGPQRTEADRLVQVADNEHPQEMSADALPAGSEG